MVLNKQGVPNRKVWLFSPCRYKTGAYEAICLPDPNSITVDGMISWGYHVATLVEDPLLGELVYDYFINTERPLRLQEWISIQGLSTYQLRVEPAHNYLFYSESAPDQLESLFTGEFFRYEGEALEGEWVAKGLAVNQTAYDFYLEEIKTRPEGQLRYEYQLLVGNINTFETIIRDQQEPAELPAGLVQKHHRLLAHYQQRYEYYLARWRTQLLLLEQPEMVNWQPEEPRTHLPYSWHTNNYVHDDLILSNPMGLN
ncbi:hypothetical protein BLX24_25245 [Arsenicibacter rosenii]|uniref:Protein glutaminase domain-containing protein n=2 Tax=Arsenicibacter rosenii TaxID=1750698 RepID=A0A1S2VC48_9BACT|nr:hypothetical protein BLX24_25245 [Arsenicibacter rosenii]